MWALIGCVMAALWRMFVAQADSPLRGAMQHSDKARVPFTAFDGRVLQAGSNGTIAGSNRTRFGAGEEGAQ